MGTYIIRRLIVGIVVLFLVTLIVFALLYIIPGDPALMVLGEHATAEQLAELRAELRLDQPVIIQYGYWLGNALKGDLGESLFYRQDVASLIADRLPITMYLSLVSLAISTILGIGAGIICAVRRGTLLDAIITLVANMGIAIPVFWLGVLGIYFFGLKLGWLPVLGYTSPFDNLLLSTKQAIMPIICMSVFPIAILVRQTRSSILEVIKQDYIRTAWSKGLNERVIVLKHALKNALIPVVTLLGLLFRVVVSGVVLVEMIFNIPGMGRLLVEAVFNKDFVTVQGCTLVITIAVLLINLIVDISYGWLDPRIRYE